MAMLLSARREYQAEMDKKSLARVEQQIMQEELDVKLAKAIREEEENVCDQKSMRESLDEQLAKAMQEEEDLRVAREIDDEVKATPRPELAPASQTPCLQQVKTWRFHQPPLPSHQRERAFPSPVNSHENFNMSSLVAAPR